MVAKRGVGHAARQCHGGEGRVLPEVPAVAQVERPGPADVDDQGAFALLAPLIARGGDPLVEADQRRRRDLAGQTDRVDDDVDARERRSHKNGIGQVDGAHVVAVGY